MLLVVTSCALELVIFLHIHPFMPIVVSFSRAQSIQRCMDQQLVVAMACYNSPVGDNETRLSVIHIVLATAPPQAMVFDVQVCAHMTTYIYFVVGEFQNLEMEIKYMPAQHVARHCALSTVQLTS